ncbi:MAG: exodeoxyribonuclease VII small subunit [Clostridia bacterium]|nr:exodeoxyribonuclease VII small subunit [Clostridia bacterium]
MENIKFEEAMARLDEILKQLETGKLELEDSINRYKEGMDLIKYCKSKLTSYEADIAKVVITESGVKNED